MKKSFSILISLLIIAFTLIGCGSEKQQQHIPLDRLSHQTQTESESSAQSQETQSASENIEQNQEVQETVSSDNTISQSINFLGWVDYDKKFEDMDLKNNGFTALNVPAKDGEGSAQKFTSEKEAVEFVNSKIMPNDMFDLEYTVIDGVESVVFNINSGGGTGRSSYPASENNGSVIFVIEYNSDYYMNPWDFYYEESTKTLYAQMKEDHRAVKSMDQINNAPGGLLYVVFEDFNTEVKNIALIKPDPEDKEF